MKKIILVLAVLCLLCGCSNGGNKKSFTSLYERYCKEPWAEVGSDGSYLSIDSNPYDVDDKKSGSSEYFSEAWEAVKNINKELGFTDAVNKKMGETSSLDGRQSESINGVNLSWKYHPDKGMEIMYTFEANSK